jgi:hypothetical protein
MAELTYNVDQDDAGNHHVAHKEDRRDPLGVSIAAACVHPHWAHDRGSPGVTRADLEHGKHRSREVPKQHLRVACDHGVRSRDGRKRPPIRG